MVRCLQHRRLTEIKVYALSAPAFMDSVNFIVPWLWCRQIRMGAFETAAAIAPVPTCTCYKKLFHCGRSRLHVEIGNRRWVPPHYKLHCTLVGMQANGKGAFQTGYCFYVHRGFTIFGEVFKTKFPKAILWDTFVGQSKVKNVLVVTQINSGCGWILHRTRCGCSPSFCQQTPSK